MCVLNVYMCAEQCHRAAWCRAMWLYWCEAKHHVIWCCCVATVWWRNPCSLARLDLLTCLCNSVCKQQCMSTANSLGNVHGRARFGKQQNTCSVETLSVLVCIGLFPLFLYCSLHAMLNMKDQVQQKHVAEITTHGAMLHSVLDLRTCISAMPCP